jgi:hypothetical protein
MRPVIAGAKTHRGLAPETLLVTREPARRFLSNFSVPVLNVVVAGLRMIGISGLRLQCLEVP